MPRYKIRNQKGLNFLTENVGCLLEIDMIEDLQPSSGFKYFPKNF